MSEASPHFEDTSILADTKKLLGLESSYDVFDQDVLIHINSVFGTLSQLGLEVPNFYVADETTTWGDFTKLYALSSPLLSALRSYVYIKVRLLFDPPTTSYLLESFKEQASELEWRLSAEREEKLWLTRQSLMP